MRLIICCLSLCCLALSATACTDTNSSDDAIQLDGQTDTSSDTRSDTSADATDVSTDTSIDVPTDTVVGLPEPENHRPEATPCDNERNDTEPVMDPNVPADCTVHADCTQGDNGRCSGNSHDGYYCTYDGCFADTDCAGMCQCGGGFRSDHNVCLGGNCATNSDCGEGGWCSPTLGDCGNYTGTEAYYCRTPEDECLNDSDCTDEPGNFGGGYCAYDPQIGHWACSYQHCAG